MEYAAAEDPLSAFHSLLVGVPVALILTAVFICLFIEAAESRWDGHK